MKYKLHIELLSDTCCGSGEGNGIDIDIAPSYDENGLPYIGGRRIKGLLLENAKFLRRLRDDHATTKTVEFLFGTVTQQGALRITNATLVGAAEIIDGLRTLEDDYKSILTRSAVENCFTAYRYGTAIEPTGIAKEKSLRKIGVVPKGAAFEAEIEVVLPFTDAAREQDVQQGQPADSFQTSAALLESCVKLLRGIGLNRTRGLGEVRCTLTPMDDRGGNSSGSTYGTAPGSSLVSAAEAVLKDTRKQLEAMDEHADACLTYRVKLLSPLLSKSDYLMGSMLQGYFVSRLAVKMPAEKTSTSDDTALSDAVLSEFLKNVRFGMGYLAQGAETYLPTPLGYVVKKLEAAKEKGYCVYSLADGYKPEAGVQYLKWGGYYHIGHKAGAPAGIERARIETSVEFHFNKEKRQIYSLESLNSGQEFEGRIYGSVSHLRKIAELALETRGKLNLGGSTNTQYGRAEITLKVEKMRSDSAASDFANRQMGSTSENKQMGNTSEHKQRGKYILQLLSDAVLVDICGINRADSKTLRSAVMREVLALKDREGDKEGEREGKKKGVIPNVYMATGKVSGYNAKWALPKRQFASIVKGSQVVIDLGENDANVQIPTRGFLGIMRNEGYGEYLVRPVIAENDACQGILVQDAKDGNTEAREGGEARATRTEQNTETGKNEKTGKAAARSETFVAFRNKVLFQHAKALVQAAGEACAVNYLKPSKTKISISSASRLMNAHKAAWNSDDYGKTLSQYIEQNYAGDSNADIRAFAQHALDAFAELFPMTAEKKAQVMSGGSPAKAQKAQNTAGGNPARAQKSHDTAGGNPAKAQEAQNTAGGNPEKDEKAERDPLAGLTSDMKAVLRESYYNPLLGAFMQSYISRSKLVFKQRASAQNKAAEGQSENTPSETAQGQEGGKA